MLTIIAEVCTHPGAHHRDAVLALFKSVMPTVLKEAGCHGYAPMLDADVNADFQSTDANCIVMIEKWEDMAALRAHMETPHMVAFHEQAGEHIAGIKVKILDAA